MRIVAGQYRGRPIQPPEGRNTRPTIDRVREALFSSLFSLRGGFDDAIVVDAFAGSGALGLEALSRGASQVVFFEKDRNALTALRRNIESLHVQDSVRVCASDVLLNPPTNFAAPFDLVLLDPPYKIPAREVISFVNEIRSAALLAPDAIITYEHGSDALEDVQREAEAAGLIVVSQKKYGKTRITILKES